MKYGTRWLPFDDSEDLALPVWEREPVNTPVSVQSEGRSHRVTPFLSVQANEAICDAELRSAGLLESGPPVDIDRYVFNRFGITPEFEEMAPLGATHFDPESGTPRRIILQKRLVMNESVSKQRRVRATLAHEAGHALLHWPLFRPRVETIGCTQSLRQLRPTSLDHPASGRCGTPGCFCEHQANVAIGAFLLPLSLFRSALAEAEAEFSSGGRAGEAVHSDHRGWHDDVDYYLGDLFDVNPQVVTERRKGLRRNEPGTPLTNERAAQLLRTHWYRALTADAKTFL